MAGIVCLVCRNCEQHWVCMVATLGVLSYVILAESDMDCLYVEGCRASSAKYHVHLVSV